MTAEYRGKKGNFPMHLDVRNCDRKVWGLCVTHSGSPSIMVWEPRRKYDDPFSKRLDLCFTPHTLNGLESTCSEACRTSCGKLWRKEWRSLWPGVGRFFVFEARRRQGGKAWEVSPPKATNVLYKRPRGRKEEEFLPSPYSVEMWWKTWSKNNDSCNKGLDGLFRFQTLSGLESR